MYMNIYIYAYIYMSSRYCHTNSWLKSHESHVSWPFSFQRNTWTTRGAATWIWCTAWTTSKRLRSVKSPGIGGGLIVFQQLGTDADHGKPHLATGTGSRLWKMGEAIRRWQFSWVCHGYIMDCNGFIYLYTHNQGVFSWSGDIFTLKQAQCCC